jgi:hypothetical protein
MGTPRCPQKEKIWIKKSDDNTLLEKLMLFSILKANSFSTAAPGSLCAKLCTTILNIAIVLKVAHSSFDSQLFIEQFSFISLVLS